MGLFNSKLSPNDPKVVSLLREMNTVQVDKADLLIINKVLRALELKEKMINYRKFTGFNVASLNSNSLALNIPTDKQITLCENGTLQIVDHNYFDVLSIKY